MPRLSLKPGASFFKKIVQGTVGAQSICDDLSHYGHQMVELERGSTDTKIWKEVKRKRVRIPDLVCVNCGLRVESRAKTKAELTMSHSESDEAREWDFGMVNEDLIAFPVCEPSKEEFWSDGKLENQHSYWHERNWVQWTVQGCINYFQVKAFRQTKPKKKAAKGATEGSEKTLEWSATFSTREGRVESARNKRITISRYSDGHRHTWNVGNEKAILVSEHEEVRNNQVIEASVAPLKLSELRCTKEVSRSHISRLLQSRERTQRFTGAKLARLRREQSVAKQMREIVSDAEEDIYVSLESVSYLVGIQGSSARELFRPYLESLDEQCRLEAVIALGETGTAECIEILAEILHDPRNESFLRSAAAWSLGRNGSSSAAEHLKRAFSDVEHTLREDALQGMVSLGGPAIPVLLDGLRGIDEDVAAGCAEALRQQQPLSNENIENLVQELKQENPSRWAVWLTGHLPRESVASRIAELQTTAPELHYAISLLWAFVSSWISSNWEQRFSAYLPHNETHHGS